MTSRRNVQRLNEVAQYHEKMPEARNKMREIHTYCVGLAAAAFIISALACGPTLLHGQQDGQATQTNQSGEVKTPVPTLDPTKEKELEDNIKTAIPHTQTPTPSKADPDQGSPTPPPTEPLLPSRTPAPTPQPAVVPTPTPSPYASITIDADFCSNVSLYDPAYYRGRDGYTAANYIQIKCSELVGRIIGERCTPSDGNLLDPEAKSCIQRNAESVRDYTIRSSVFPECFSEQVQTESQFLECTHNKGNNDSRLRAQLVETRIAIRAVVDQDKRVLEAEEDAWTCVRQVTENKPPPDYVDTSRLLFWQGWNSAENAKRLSQLGEPRLEKIRQYMLLVDQCALEANVYQARYDAFMAELRHMMRAEPERVEAWKKLGTLSAMEEFGPEMLRP